MNETIEVFNMLMMYLGYMCFFVFILVALVTEINSRWQLYIERKIEKYLKEREKQCTHTK